MGSVIGTESGSPTGVRIDKVISTGPVPLFFALCTIPSASAIVVPA